MVERPAPGQPWQGKFCEHPGCQKPAIDAIGGIWHCAEHSAWAVQLADDIENMDC